MLSYRITPVDENLLDLLEKGFTTDSNSGHVESDGCIPSEGYKEFADAIENFEIRDDDVWVCSYPKSAHRITPVDGDLVDLLRKVFVPDPNYDFIKIDGCILTEGYRIFADAIENFEIRDDDVWVCTFPKAGTTWAQEMVWCIANDLDFEKAKVSLDKRFPYLNYSTRTSKIKLEQQNPEIKSTNDSKDGVTQVAKMSSPRFIKTHLPINLHPRQLRDGDKKAKIIYVARNAKDTCISYFHFCKLMYGINGSLNDFCELFLGDTLVFTSYWNHVLGFWHKRNHPNILFLKYEDMKKNLPSVIEQTATFLGKSLTTDQISSLSEHLSFSKMKNNPAVNWEEKISQHQQLWQAEREGSFMRSGTTEQWKTDMSTEMIKRFDDWIDENLKGSGLSL